MNWTTKQFEKLKWIENFLSKFPLLDVLFLRSRSRSSSFFSNRAYHVSGDSIKLFLKVKFLTISRLKFWLWLNREISILTFFGGVDRHPTCWSIGTWLQTDDYLILIGPTKIPLARTLLRNKVLKQLVSFD